MYVMVQTSFTHADSADLRVRLHLQTHLTLLKQFSFQLQRFLPVVVSLNHGLNHVHLSHFQLVLDCLMINHGGYQASILTLAWEQMNSLWHFSYLRYMSGVTKLYMYIPTFSICTSRAYSSLSAKQNSSSASASFRALAENRACILCFTAVCNWAYNDRHCSIQDMVLPN